MPSHAKTAKPKNSMALMQNLVFMSASASGAKPKTPMQGTPQLGAQHHSARHSVLTPRGQCPHAPQATPPQHPSTPAPYAGQYTPGMRTEQAKKPCTGQPPQPQPQSQHPRQPSPPQEQDQQVPPQQPKRKQPDRQAAGPPAGSERLHPWITDLMDKLGYEVSNTKKVSLPERLHSSERLTGGKAGRPFVRAKIRPDAPSAPQASVTVKATLSSEEVWQRAWQFATEYNLLTRDTSSASKQKRDHTTAFGALVRAAIASASQRRCFTSMLHATGGDGGVQ